MPGEGGFVGGDARESDLLEDRCRGRERDGTEHVGRAGLLAIREIGPDDVVEGDQVDRAAAGVVGLRGERDARPDERTRPERRVQLVRRHRDEVEVAGIVVRAHVDRAVGRQLRGVHQDAAADGVHLLGEPVHRREHTGDVGRARDREQRDAARVFVEAPVEVLFVERAVGVGADAHRAGAGAPATAVRSNGARAGSSGPRRRRRSRSNARAC